MTRKDFQIIATILAKCEVKDKDAVNSILRTTNPNFKSERFWDYVEKMKNN